MPEIGGGVEASRLGGYYATTGVRPTGASARSGAVGAAADAPTASDAGNEAATPSSVVSLSTAGRAAAGSSLQLSPDEQREVERLKARDREVRAHEQAHQAAAGGLATGGASYTYQRGPDGVSYAVGGEVPISLREGRTPEETIANAQTIRAAALAPADPSPQDRAVAAAAGQLEARARTEQARAESEVVAGEADAAEQSAAGLLNGLPGLGDDAVPVSSDAAEPADSPIPTGDSATRVARTRDSLANVYGLIAASSGGFSVRA